MQYQTDSFNSLQHTTIFTQCWFPEEDARAVVILAHGLGEHSGRYAHVAAHLVARGYALCALDHRGHGKSGGPRALIDSMNEYVADLRTYFEQVRAALPQLPVFLYGHSMGSVISLLFAFRYQNELTGLITTGTALKLSGMNAVTAPLITLAGKVIPRVRLIPIDATSISRDPAVVQRYRDDPLVYHQAIPAGMISALHRDGQACIAKLPKLRVPYLALHGRDDQLIPVSAAEIVRQHSGAPDTIVQVYTKLHHEVHNEPEQAQVLADITGWLDAHLPDPS